MKRIVLATATALTLLVVPATSASAKVSSGCTFYRGTTTCTDVQGSHGSFDTHHGNTDSNGNDTGGGTCKVTGPDHTC
jgi:hypothetical protein